MIIAVVLVDSLRADHLGCYGYNEQTSPHIDRIADESLLYVNAFSQSNWTYPSVYSIISGRYPSCLNLTWFNQVIHHEYKTFPDILAENGFSTAIFAGFEFLIHPSGFGSHFQKQALLPLNDNTLSHLREWVKNNRNSFLFWHIGEYVHEPFFAERHKVNRFLSKNLHGYDPHPAVKTLTSPLNGAGMEDNTHILRTLIGDINKRLVHLNADDIQYLLACYDAGIHKVDGFIGQFHDMLRNESDDYLFFLIADHGQGFLEHAILGHGLGVYDEMIHVPMILDLSGKYQGRVTHSAELLDISPTIMEAVGLSGTFPQDGYSLLTGIENENSFPEKEIISEGYPFICIRNSSYKLITSYFSFLKLGDVCRKLLAKSKTKSNLRNIKACCMQDLLYDIFTDPMEMRNLRWKNQIVYRQLKDRLNQFMAGSGTSALMPTEIDIEDALMRKRLRDLGYL